MIHKIKNNHVLQHEERITKVKLRKILFKINMLQKTKIIQFIIKHLLLMSYSLKISFNMDDVFGEKNWFKNGMKSIRISSAFIRLDHWSTASLCGYLSDARNQCLIRIFGLKYFQRILQSLITHTIILIPSIRFTFLLWTATSGTV
jgi:hypothetical protein